LRQFAKLSRNETPVGSLHPFELGISTLRWPYPPHYRTAFAFSDILYPLRLPLSLRSGYHSPNGCGAHRAYPVDCCGDALRLGWGLSPGGVFGCCCLWLTQTVRPTLPFWLRPISLFGRFRLTRCSTLHIRSTFRCFPRLPPHWASRLWSLSPGLCTKPLPAMRTWVGTPEHHRAYII
jgi:hypothetical protein